MGEIGGNDYNNALLAGKSIEQVQAYVPLVIETIASAINVRIMVVTKVVFFFNIGYELEACLIFQGCMVCRS